MNDTTGVDGFEAGLLIHARPDHIASSGRSLLFQSEQHQTHRHARRQRKQQTRFGILDA